MAFTGPQTAAHTLVLGAAAQPDGHVRRALLPLGHGVRLHERPGARHDLVLPVQDAVRVEPAWVEATLVDVAGLGWGERDTGRGVLRGARSVGGEVPRVGRDQIADGG